MTRRVKISELKAKLSEYLGYVKRGHTIEVLDRDRPVARIQPLQEQTGGLRMRRGVGRLSDVSLPASLQLKIDVVALLREDRDAR